MEADIRLSLLPGTRMQRQDGRLLLVPPLHWYEANHVVTFGDRDAITGEIMRRLLEGGGTEQALREAASATGITGLAVLTYIIDRLDALAILCRDYYRGGGLGMRLRPLSQRFRWRTPAPARPNAPRQANAPRKANDPRKEGRISASELDAALSPFAYLRREGEGMCLQSPLSHAAVDIVDADMLAYIATLGMAQTPHNLNETERNGVLVMLRAGGFLVDGGDPRQDTMLRQWEFHDLLFHSRSRLGRHRGSYGQTYRFAGEVDPVPVAKPPCGGTRIPLAPLCAATVAARSKPVFTVMEQRRSRRWAGANALGLAELGEFFGRCARERERLHDGHQELSSRPYPSGGSLYEQELYLAAVRCRDLQRGLYRYVPEAHELETVNSAGADFEELIRHARITSAVEDIQVLIVISARFQRVSWKYQGMAYALMLKNLGVLYQSMSLIAEDMDLSACVLGGGDAEVFASAAGTAYLEESSIGEFLLASRGGSDEPRNLQRSRGRH